jgi:hypothetical protein
MSETEEDRRYYQAAEAAFIRRRGTPFLLSPRDFALLRQWRALAVPIEAVEQGIDQAFSRREERSARGRVNSLSYCAEAVLEAWERRAEMSVGRGGTRGGAEPDATLAIAGFQAQLADLARRRSDLAAPIEAAARSLERIGKSGKSAEDIEASLARLDKRLAQALADALPAAEGESLSRAVQASLNRVSAAMDAAAAERTARALMRRALREHLGLPRLTLLP